MTLPFQTVEKTCHSEPVRTLAWESPGQEGEPPDMRPKNRGDCHTSDIGRWFAMTAFFFLLC